MSCVSCISSAFVWPEIAVDVVACGVALNKKLGSSGMLCAVLNAGFADGSWYYGRIFGKS